MAKNLPTMQDTRVWSQGWEYPLEKEMATHSSILVWWIPWTEEPGGLQPMGLQRVGHNWVTEHSTQSNRWLYHKEINDNKVMRNGREEWDCSVKGGWSISGTLLFEDGFRLVEICFANFRAITFKKNSIKIFWNPKVSQSEFYQAFKDVIPILKI